MMYGSERMCRVGEWAEFRAACFRSPISISSYIRATGDGIQTNWLGGRLTSTQKTFELPVRINEGNSFTLGNGSPCHR